MTDKEVMQMALDTLNADKNHASYESGVYSTIEALRTALAQPEKEWVGLTKDEIEVWDLPVSPTVYEFAQFVEAKIKEKNNG